MITIKKSTRRKIFENLEVIVTALILALVIRAFIVQAYKIPTGSMIPTLLVGDHILVNKFLYGVKIPFTEKRVLPIVNPKRGDIIVFRYPEDPERDFIKRVIAAEGDVIEERDKVVSVNGEAVSEPYARHTDEAIKPPSTDQRDSFGPIIVPKDKFFVMGDNRDQSYDSRYWGFVDISDIRGKALIIYWSWDGEKHVPRIKRMFHTVN